MTSYRRPPRMGRFKTTRPAANQATYASAFVAYKGRPEPALNQKVRVYRNLNNGLFSIVMLEGPHKGTVVGYAPAVGLKEVTMHVTKQRERTLREKHRNVHAWVHGRYIGCADCPPLPFQQGKRVTYMPFVRPYFFSRARPDVPITKLDAAWAYERDLHTLDGNV